MSDLDLNWIASVSGAKSACRGARIQALWGGYGELLRVELSGGARDSVIVKWVRPPRRSSRADLSHARKQRSYEVETQFYKSHSRRCDDACRVATLIESRRRNDEWLLVLEDLDAAGFAGRVRTAHAEDVQRCLAWLAAFHARFLGTPPEGLWKTGTYWHLATRPDELANLDDERLRAAAPVLDQKLRAAAHQTLVHGDAKLANFCFAEAHAGVAAVDFQYVGGGCGMKDVAYFLGSCSYSGHEVTDARYLDAYFRMLRAALPASVDGALLEREWRALYPVACADFYRFLAGWAPDEWRRDRVGQRIVRDVLRELG
jgi:hypothetical protein